MPIELRKQGAARRVGERGEGAVESGVLILNHTVNFIGGGFESQIL
jgi:hypothetical protein